MTEMLKLKGLPASPGIAIGKAFVYGSREESSTVDFSGDVEKETYVESLLKRERECPTGLQSEKGIGVAIPHADIEHVLEEAFVAIFPTKTLHFHKMDEPDKEIPVDLVLLLVVKSTQGYMKFLSDLASTINDEKFAELVGSRKTKEIIDFLVKNILEKHFKVEQVERIEI